MLMPNVEKPYSATFGQISSKSNEAFSNYAQKTSFFDSNPRIKIFIKKKTSGQCRYRESGETNAAVWRYPSLKSKTTRFIIVFLTS